MVLASSWISSTLFFSSFQRASSSASWALACSSACCSSSIRFVIAGAGGPLAIEDADFHLEVIDLAAAVLDGGRDGVQANGHPGAGGVEQADRLVGQLPGRDVAMRELDRALDGFLEDPHAVVLLQDAGESPHHPNGDFLGGLLDLHDLEPAGQCRVLLEVLLVLGPGGGRDRAQLAAGERRLEQVGRVALPGRASGPDHGVCLVDEENDRNRRGLDLGDDLLEPVLELALDSGAGLKQAKVEGAQDHVLERGRHVALGDPPRQALDHGRLADAGLAGQDRVVLAAADEDVHHLADLGLTPDDRIDLPLLRASGQVDRELIKGRRLGHSGFGLARLGRGAARGGRRPLVLG